MTGAGADLLLTPAEMQRVDDACPALGVATGALMEAAGRAVADAIAASFTPRRTVFLCGPGNNGGDGYVAARLLAARGWDVAIEALGDPAALTGDALAAARAWPGAIRALTAHAPDADLIVDALFGAGLNRPLSGAPAHLAERLAGDAARIVAVDTPSGLPGDGRAPNGAHFAAGLTITFCRKKPAHVLEPGRSLCGRVLLADIGAPDQAVAAIGAALWENSPALWLGALPRAGPQSHKHSRGRLGVASGGVSTSGAARLAALAGARIGAGYVTLVCPSSAVLVNAAHLTSTLIAAADAIADLQAEAARADAFVLGPAFGLGERARQAVAAIAALAKPLVLDADALSAHADDPAALFRAAHGGCVLTPHAGEFGRLFADLLAAPLSKIEQTRQAAARAGCVVLFKGADTVIASPDGRAAVNTNAAADLATAGSGDALAGMIGGLMAQGAPAFEAACAAAWIHGAAGAAFGPGLVADDLPGLIPPVLKSLFRA